jgi:apolipoprotein N-acyltransferase
MFKTMLHRLGRSLIPPVASGLLLALSFPLYDFESLAWIALIPLLLAVRGSSWKTAFGQGWLAGLVFFAMTLHWVINAMHEYGKLSFVVSFLVMLLLAGYCALFVGSFCTVLTLIPDRRGMIRTWTAPALWVALEWVRAHLFSGFPWALLGYSQYHHLSVIQISDVTGVYGVSFLVVLANVVAARVAGALLSRSDIAERRIPLPWVAAPLAALLLAGVVAYGQWRLSPQRDSASDQTVRIGVVQPNVDQAQKWDVAYRRDTIDRHKRLTAQVEDGADLIIWPEAATPFLFEVETAYKEELLHFVRERGVPLLFGSPAVESRSAGRIRLLNSAYLVSSDGAVLDRYDKIHLVPFGEYIPLQTILSFLDKLVVGIGDFVPGAGPRVIGAPGGRLGIVICFEVIFPDLVRQFVDQGADYMVTITNDAWFGRSGAPYQHFAMVVFRAIENRVAFARAANTGISGFIDAEGHILRTTELFVEGALSGEVRTGGPRTFYTAYGDVFAHLCVILTVLMSAVAWYQGRRREQREARRMHARRSEEPTGYPPDEF